ncbi:hypothetical protein BBH99_18925 [Chryseobacterium contaminans]|uniref:Uncharacterized protein n=1 Tax=Chryseobacterium contaminans TaxID=1423959 RepID=A0A1M7CWC1_9FLAO|nr:hypothetical protein BBH99_18925 [Chryseobacterium contaminans]SHL71413.1 hypothetical protein SAMN05444407_105394 [Chryseobacterium contaminans]
MEISTIKEHLCLCRVLQNRFGIYPHYPKNTKKLILTEAIIDAISLLQIKDIVQKGCHTELVKVIVYFETNRLNE